MAALIAPGATMVLADGGVPAVQSPWAPLRWPDDSAACEGTQVAIRLLGDTLLAAWWRSDSAQAPELRVARSSNGGIHWDSAGTVGVAPLSRSACRRPPPGVAMDRVSGTVFLAYFGMTADSAGIVVGRLVSGGPATAPSATPTAVPAALVSPGDAPRAAAIAVDGDTVVIAFQGQGSADGSIWLAISTGTRHIPEVVGEVSNGETAAFAPMVAFGQARVAVAWNVGRRGPDGPAVVARVGRIRR
ncbi:MAG: hypothetical protein O2973_01685 [Gemmatimonadetes bacterium]|nr:hypothetical protein [Gemmatimonadota bacterium]